MKVLAIETSCDETGIALVEGVARDPDAGGMRLEFTILKAALLSQAALHSPYGGVYPNLAKREHIKNLPILLEQVLGEFRKETPSKAKESPFGIDAVAVTSGPGLEPALWSGITFAQKLAKEKNLPLLPVNHMEGHLISSLAQDGKLEDVALPVLGLLVSGGHTEFVLMREWFVYELVGQTLDDAVGEAFDKVARMLGLPYPGGPEISKLAEQHRKENVSDKSLAQGLPVEAGLGGGQTEDPRGLLGNTFSLKLPRPMLNTNNCDVSFSGLKTAVLYALRDFQKSKATPSKAKESPLTQKEKAEFAREFEDAVADILVAKTRRALQQTGAQTFVLGGGVAANTHIRAQLQKLITEEFPQVAFRLPELSITGDNAVMIAQAALARSLAGVQTVPDRIIIRAEGKLSLQTTK